MGQPYRGTKRRTAMLMVLSLNRTLGYDFAWRTSGTRCIFVPNPQHFPVQWASRTHAGTPLLPMPLMKHGAHIPLGGSLGAFLFLLPVPHSAAALLSRFSCTSRR
uniref:Uncharacterized protein n=1 Tax=Opuntia streptacantha TaxID=393608 RepID=A0A7C9DIX8_OPUST